jgi:hypothetical protein
LHGERMSVTARAIAIDTTPRVTVRDGSQKTRLP